jgi:leucyl-tRNA synthetase
LRDLGWVDLSEPFARLLTQGMVIKDGAKMSKSKGNVVDPDELVRVYGADTARLFSMFAAPPEKDLDWSEQGVEGSHRFLGRVWRLASTQGAPPVLDDPGLEGAASQDRAFRSLIHETIFRVTRDIGERMHFNTAIAAVMELVNAIYAYRGSGASQNAALVGFATSTVLRLLFPFVPHITSELWERTGAVPGLADMPWPKHDPTALTRESVEIAVQINGKLRSRLVVPADADGDALVELALADERVARELAGRTPRKTIVVPGRLVNLVA